MDGTYDIRELAEDVVQVHEIAAVDIGEVRFATDDLGYSVQDVDGRVGEVIHDGHVVAALHELYDRVGAYIAGTACNEYSTHLRFQIYDL